MRKLAFAIPTYKRPKMLIEAILSIYNSAKGFEDQIEIFVTDNSPDSTAKEALKTLPQVGIPIHYLKNEVNIGVERNLLKSVDCAQGEYIWLFSDDDKLTPEAIPLVFEKLKSTPRFVVVNYSIWQKDFSAPIKESNFSIVGDQSFKDPNELLGTFGIHIGYVSCIVMKRSAIYEVPLEIRDRYIVSGFPWVYSIYASLIKNCNVEYISKTVVQNRSNNSTAYENHDWHEIFLTGTKMIFSSLQKIGYSRRSVKIANRRVILDFILFNIIGLKFAKLKKRWFSFLLVKTYFTEWLCWGFCLPLWFAPLRLLEKKRERVIRLPISIRNRFPKILSLESRV